MYVIAEIGVNHNGKLTLAKEMVDAAKRSGADAVKFQTFKAIELAHPSAPKVAYQKETTLANESHLQMLQSLELSLDNHLELKEYCEKLGIDFLSTPYDIESARFLFNIGIKYFKTASADIVDLPLHSYIAKTKLPTIIATGMATLGEIERVVNIYLENGNQDIVLLHCVSNYPCADDSINLRAMKTMAESFGLPIGYSDHGVGSLAAALSVSIGAKVVEKHFTLNKMLPGPDQKASSTPEEFEELIQNIRRAELILGSSRKTCQKEELEMRKISRKSLVYSRDMYEGEIITLEDLKLMRPGDGLEFTYAEFLVGKILSKNVNVGSKVSFSDLN